MNKLALVAISLFVVVEILVGDCVVQGIPLWVVGLIGFSLIWMGIICVKEKSKSKTGIKKGIMISFFYLCLNISNDEAINKNSIPVCTQKIV